MKLMIGLSLILLVGAGIAQNLSDNITVKTPEIDNNSAFFHQPENICFWILGDHVRMVECKMSEGPFIWADGNDPNANDAQN